MASTRPQPPTRFWVASSRMQYRPNPRRSLCWVRDWLDSPERCGASCRRNQGEIAAIVKAIGRGADGLFAPARIAVRDARSCDLDGQHDLGAAAQTAEEIAESFGET